MEFSAFNWRLARALFVSKCIVSGMHQRFSPMSCLVLLKFVGSIEMFGSLLSGNVENFLHGSFLVIHTLQIVL